MKSHKYAVGISQMLTDVNTEIFLRKPSLLLEWWEWLSWECEGIQQGHCWSFFKCSIYHSLGFVLQNLISLLKSFSVTSKICSSNLLRVWSYPCIAYCLVASTKVQASMW